MKLLVLAATALTSIAVEAGSIAHDQVQPFPQPNPTTDVEKAAINFKPSLVIKNGCHPYPAVNAAGETSGGLKPTGSRMGGCGGSELGSQVYGRAMLYNNHWAFMYAWYFPKDQVSGIFGDFGVRHRWLSAVVWIDDPALETATVLAASTQTTITGSYAINRPVARGNINGNTVLMAYNDDLEYHSIELTTEKGEFQDLIMWEQMTDEARAALNVTDFGEDNNVPVSDVFFETYLGYASTYSTRYQTISIWNSSA